MSKERQLKRAQGNPYGASRKRVQGIVPVLNAAIRHVRINAREWNRLYTTPDGYLSGEHYSTGYVRNLAGVKFAIFRVERWGLFGFRVAIMLKDSETRIYGEPQAAIFRHVPDDPAENQECIDAARDDASRWLSRIIESATKSSP